MRFLIDESLPRAVGRALSNAQHDVDRGAREADARIVVSADLDFSNALRFPPRRHPGILVARLPDTAAPNTIAARLLDAITQAGTALDGAITVVEVHAFESFAGRDRPVAHPC